MARHPSRFDLAAWFDGEGFDSVGWHVAACERCRRTVEDMELVRAATRGDPMPIGRRPRRRLVHTGVALAAVSALVLAALGRGALHTPEPGAPSVASHPTTSASTPEGSHGTSRHGGRPSNGVAPVPSSSSGAPAAPTDRNTNPAAPAEAPSPASAAQPEPPLVLGVVVPAAGPDAAEGRDVVEAVRKAVEVESAEGLDGHRVELEVLTPAEAEHGDQDRVLVGGFGDAPQGNGWVLPADPAADGTAVVSGELDAHDAGMRLAQDFLDRGFDGPIGVIVGEGPDAELADGIATVAPVRTVEVSHHTSCTRQVLDLRLAGVTALAVAGPPALQSRCTAAAKEQTWQPQGGILLPPSAAYAGLQGDSWIAGARTVLGFAWPTDSTTGAEWFRQQVPGTTSYRALVSFAAAELALEVLRADGDVTPELVRAGTWRSPLFRFDDGVNQSARVVVASQDGWLTPGTDATGGSAGEGPSLVGSSPPIASPTA
ncbi:MAG: hypothetical protein ABR600_02265 [Actinomycetota bacterium]